MQVNMSDPPILLVCGCKKYETYLQAALVRMRHSAWIVLGVIGDPTLQQPYCNGTILYLPVEDTYEYLPKKLHAAYSWCFETFPHTCGIFKTDEDIVFGNVNALAGAILTNRHIPYWGIRVQTCAENYVNAVRISLRFEDKTLTPKHPGATYCFGVGYWISRAALPAVVAAKEKYAVAGLEDVCTGNVMNSAGYIPVEIAIACREVDRTKKLLNMT